jgi:hypothetical protein
MGVTQAWEPSKMTLAQTIDVEVIANHGVSMEAKAFATEMLGPMPGKWDGYDQLNDGIQKEVWSKVGYIHGLSAEAGRQIVAVGQTLIEMKEMLPHGQFPACVKAEFGWSQQWAHQLMAISERFLNHNSSCDLPSSAKVLALLASSGADDATVQQAAEERWTVKETRQRLGNERQRERSIVQEAMSVLKLSEEARQLAAKAEHISTRQLMDELELEEPPKGREHVTAGFTFCKNGVGWWKFPFEQAVMAETVACAEQEGPVELLPMVVAAQRLGKKFSTFRVRMSPKEVAKRGYPVGEGWQAEPSSERGMCLVRQIKAGHN